MTTLFITRVVTFHNGNSEIFVLENLIISFWTEMIFTSENTKDGYQRIELIVQILYKPNRNYQWSFQSYNS